MCSFLESGPASGQVVLLVHTFGLDHSMWGGQEAALRNELRVLMPGLPGFGRLRLGESGLDRCVEACAQRLAHGGSPATVAGVSHGGWVAAMLAAKHHRLVSGLVITGVRPDIARCLVELAGAVHNVHLVPLPGAGQLWPIKRPTPLTDHIRQLASLNGKERL